MASKFILIAAALLSGSGAQNITSDTYFYGDSPPVYPSRVYSP